MSLQHLPPFVPAPPPRSERVSSTYNMAQLYFPSIDGTQFKVRLRDPLVGGHGDEIPSEGLHTIRDKLPVDPSGKILFPAHRSIAPMSFTAVEDMIDPATGLPTAAIISPYYGAPILQELGGATQQQRIEWMLQICEAVEALHKEEIAHGNIHPRNIYIHDDRYAVLTDTRLYSFAAVYDMCNLSEDIKSSIIHPKTIACKRPSMLQRYEGPMIPTDLPTKQDDIFALATTLWMLFEGKEPWKEIERGRNCSRVIQEIVLRFGHQRLRRPVEMSAKLWEIVNGLFQGDSAFNPTLMMGEIMHELRHMQFSLHPSS